MGHGKGTKAIRHWEVLFRGGAMAHGPGTGTYSSGLPEKGRGRL